MNELVEAILPNGYNDTSMHNMVLIHQVPPCSGQPSIANSILWLLPTINESGETSSLSTQLLDILS